MQSYENGVLNMNNICNFHKYGLKISLMKMLLNSESSWTIFIKHYLKEISADVFSVGPKVCEIVIKKNCNPSWAVVFKAWAKFVKNNFGLFRGL